MSARADCERQTVLWLLVRHVRLDDSTARFHIATSGSSSIRSSSSFSARVTASPSSIRGKVDPMARIWATWPDERTLMTGTALGVTLVSAPAWNAAWRHRSPILRQLIVETRLAGISRRTQGGRDVVSELRGRGSEAVPPTRGKAARVDSDRDGLLLLLPQDHRRPSTVSGARARVEFRLERINAGRPSGTHGCRAGSRYDRACPGRVSKAARMGARGSRLISRACPESVRHAVGRASAARPEYAGDLVSRERNLRHGRSARSRQSPSVRGDRESAC
jgi:hypothetical protein